MMQIIEPGFFDKYKVFIVGLVMAAAMPLAEFIDNGTSNWKVIILGVGMAALSFIGKNWRGQTNSMIGIFLNGLVAVGTVMQTGKFSFMQLVIQLGAQWYALTAPDQKSRGYEQTDTIKQAKIEGEIRVPAALTNPEIKKEATEIIKNT